MINQNTLLLDQSVWDLVLDANGNIAMASSPYSIAQDVASVIRTFLGECWYNTSLGLPYWTEILGKFPAVQLITSKIEAAALTVPNVVKAKASITSFENRKLNGQILILDSDGTNNTISF